MPPFYVWVGPPRPLPGYQPCYEHNLCVVGSVLLKARAAQLALSKPGLESPVTCRGFYIGLGTARLRQNGVSCLWCFSVDSKAFYRVFLVDTKDKPPK